MSSPASPRPATVLRTVAAALCAILAGAGFALWLGLSWMQDHILSPSGFQDTAASVVIDPAFQEELVQTMLDRATFGALEDVHTGIGPVDDALERVRRSAIDGATSWLTAPERQSAWIRILNDTHDANIPLTTAAGHAPDELVVDVTALGSAVDQQVRDTVGVSPDIARQDLTVTVPGVHSGGVVDALVWLAQWRYVLPWLVAALVLLAVTTTPRRWLALAGTGLAGVLCAGVLLAVVVSSAQTVVDASAVDPVAHLVAERVVSVLRESFVGRTVTGMIWAAVVALAGVIGAVVRVRAVTYDGGHVHRG
ncbi:hypothetical protein [Kocuria tytonis]|uniref:Uncharacterized protein n=1 Tax=Kocuria tytonis TaxID=2054280 RepID=A0A495A9X4_9MICC|nr:hypothetical protein [Kocuria tytonis]RKQ36856.1 hypothetical protein C1C97_004410 [Kocuria tytonis]